MLPSPDIPRSSVDKTEATVGHSFPNHRNIRRISTIQRPRRSSHSSGGHSFIFEQILIASSPAIQRCRWRVAAWSFRQIHSPPPSRTCQEASLCPSLGRTGLCSDDVAPDVWLSLSALGQSYGSTDSSDHCQGFSIYNQYYSWRRQNVTSHTSRT